MNEQFTGNLDLRFTLAEDAKAGETLVGNGRDGMLHRATNGPAATPPPPRRAVFDDLRVGQWVALSDGKTALAGRISNGPGDREPWFSGDTNEDVHFVFTL